MDEPQEDLNAFGAEDCAGAVLALGTPPLLGCYLLCKDSLWPLVTVACILVVLATVVYGLVRFGGWSRMSSLLHVIGCILVPVYVLLTICYWTSPDAPTARYYAQKKAQKAQAESEKEANKPKEQLDEEE